MIFDINKILGNVDFSVCSVCCVNLLGLKVFFVYLFFCDMGVIGNKVNVLMLRLYYVFIFLSSKLIDKCFIFGMEGIVLCCWLLGKMNMG